MTEALLTALAWLGTYLVHSSLLLGAVALLARKRLRNQPRLLERTWKVAVLGGIVTASVQVAVVSDPFLGSLSVHSLVAQDTQSLDDANVPEAVAAEAPEAAPLEARSATPEETQARPHLVGAQVADPARR